MPPALLCCRTCNTRPPTRGCCTCRTWCLSIVPARYAATIRAKAASSRIRRRTSGRNWIGCCRVQALPFGILQIETHPFAIDQHEALIDELLPGAVILLVAEERGRRKNELDRLRAGTRPSRKPHAGAEIDAGEIGTRFETCQNRPDQVRHVLIEGQGSHSILGARLAFPERGCDGQLQVFSFMELDESGRSVSHEMRLFVQLTD